MKQQCPVHIDISWPVVNPLNIAMVRGIHLSKTHNMFGKQTIYPFLLILHYVLYILSFPFQLYITSTPNPKFLLDKPP